MQSAHAILEASRRGLIDRDGDHPSLVLCGERDESALIEWASRLEQEKIRFTVFREPDLDNQVTALATQCLDADQRKSLRGLRLLRL